MKNEGGREAGKCSKVVPTRGDRCLFIFLRSCRLFCNIFPFPVCRAQLIGDWYENRRGAQNTIIYLTIRQYYWRTDAPCANIMADRTRKKKSAKHYLNIIGAQCLVSIAYWRRGTSVRQYPHRLSVWCASPIFIPIAYKLSFTNRKRKYAEEKITATLKSKQTSIATVRYPILTVARFLTLLLFHYPLPLGKILFFAPLSR